MLSFIILSAGSFPAFLKSGEKKLQSYTFQYPFDFIHNFSGWAVLSKKERCRIKHRLYELLYDICSNFPDFDDLIITSMWRSVANNKRVGGKPNSKHLDGFAIDVKLDSVSKKLVSNNLYQVIIESNCVHIQRSEDFIKNKVLKGK